MKKFTYTENLFLEFRAVKWSGVSSHESEFVGVAALEQLKKNQNELFLFYTYIRTLRAADSIIYRAIFP